jgi:predicted MPP superfamily phosphohydrolase
VATLSRRAFLLGCVGVAAAASPAAFYGAVYEPADLEIVRKAIQIRGLPARLDGIRMAQISDLHMNQVDDIHTRMVEHVQALKPDVIVVTGDLVDSRLAVSDMQNLLGYLDAPLGIWAVPGNWDHTSEAIDDLKSALPSARVKFLINQSQAIDDGLWMVGVDDPASAHDDLNEAISNVPAEVHRLLLAHSPDIVPNLAGQTFDLILSGHTHGGQINLPFLNGAWLKDGPARKYIKGMFQVDGSPLYVNRGIGMTTLPIRIQCRPEITLFTLHAV